MTERAPEFIPSREGWMRRTPYGKWVYQQGIPVIEGWGVANPAQQEFGHWDKIGAEAFFGWALQLALRNGSSRHPLGIRASHGTSATSTVTLDREDPAIRLMYLEALRKNGLSADMPTSVGAGD